MGDNQICQAEELYAFGRRCHKKFGSCIDENCRGVEDEESRIEAKVERLEAMYMLQMPRPRIDLDVVAIVEW